MNLEGTCMSYENYVYNGRVLRDETINFSVKGLFIHEYSHHCEMYLFTYEFTLVKL